ncbi:tripartite tricarboxylate transporter substrate binding protein [Nitrincola alkalilacustris]|uniref:tripartite tricarboxylate transporter substrate binding protein n=1 Tax=Nitrincola alkalilacustris TaxID=1571224 RepID=UPI00124DECE1|nr:tripartite tricarboxylate transporter substrate binding protein [Nitrincola alkalilacustris]
MKNKMLFMFAVFVSLLLTGLPVMADDDFPSQPLTMLIGFNPGGSTDVQGRVLAEVLSEQLGQPVNIIHHPGAGGGAAAAMLASSTDQGYIFQYGLSLPFTFAPLASPASYELNSFRYVAGITLDQAAIVTGPDKPFKTWLELIDYAKANPGLIYATQNIQDRFIINRIAKLEGLTIRIVPTTGGAGMAPLIVSGDADFAFSGGTHSAYTDSGQMHVLASLADERLVYYPEAPTLRELGYDVSMHAVRVVAVPVDTPDDHVKVLAEALEAVTRDPRFIQVTEERIKMPVVFMNSEELDTLFASQVEEYKQLIEDSNE